MEINSRFGASSGISLLQVLRAPLLLFLPTRVFDSLVVIVVVVVVVLLLLMTAHCYNFVVDDEFAFSSGRRRGCTSRRARRRWTASS